VALAQKLGIPVYLDLDYLVEELGHGHVEVVA
jgi:hypothetical protein